MHDYKKWLAKKGLTSSVASGTNFRMSKGLDPTDAQYKKLGLSNPGPPGGDPSQVDTIPDRATVQKAVAKYSQSLDKKAKSPVRGMKSIGKGPGKKGDMMDQLRDQLGDRLGHGSGKYQPLPAPNKPKTVATPEMLAEAAANAERLREQAALKDSGFSNNVWKPGPGNKSKAMAKAAHSFPMKNKKVK